MGKRRKAAKEQVNGKRKYCKKANAGETPKAETRGLVVIRNGNRLWKHWDCRRTEAQIGG